jgi:two-component system OmpR family response regulator
VFLLSSARAMVAQPKILVVDDEPDIRTLVVNCLRTGGFDGLTAGDGDAMRRVLAANPVELVILDLTLEGEDGLTLLGELRAAGMPVIILTGRGEPVDRVIGLELGADDYLGKPFEPRELVARVRSVLRRAHPERTAPDGERIEFHGFILDLPGRRLVAPDGGEVELTAAQFDLLAVFARNPNRVLDRDTLLESARQRRGTPYDRSIDIHIVNLRRKLEADPKHPRIIKTVRGAGYIFTPG